CPSTRSGTAFRQAAHTLGRCPSARSGTAGRSDRIVKRPFDTLRNRVSSSGTHTRALPFERLCSGAPPPHFTM
ncbi:MAG: hypothetical protein LBS86_03115, partial [Treponema sp.]|nr:hypothetical protein [Treponema sp.]